MAIALASYSKETGKKLIKCAHIVWQLAQKIEFHPSFRHSCFIQMRLPFTLIVTLKQYSLKPKFFFLPFALIKFLVLMLQCSETLISDLFLPMKI